MTISLVPFGAHAIWESPVARFGSNKSAICTGKTADRDEELWAKGQAGPIHERRCR
jgi:hypothetical protein